MTVRQNVEYRLRMKRVPAAERRQRADRALEMVRLGDLGARAPRQLSGGQQQRVALARALVNRRRVVLPLSLPGVAAGATFAFVLSMGDFLARQLLGGTDSALMVSNLVWSLFGVAYNWPLGAAVSVVIVALTLVLLWLMARLERRLGDGGGPAERARSGVVRA